MLVLVEGFFFCSLLLWVTDDVRAGEKRDFVYAASRVILFGD